LWHRVAETLTNYESEFPTEAGLAGQVECCTSMTILPFILVVVWDSMYGTALPGGPYYSLHVLGRNPFSIQVNGEIPIVFNRTRSRYLFWNPLH